MRMILVVAAASWCSLSVQGAGVRIQVMRFALLIVLTIGLASVALRINSDGAASRKATPRPSVTVPATPSATSPATSSPQVLPTASTRAPGPAKPRSTGSTGATGAAGGAGARQLPVTGWDATAKLCAVALLLIAAGTLATRAGAPRRQPAPTVHD
jgi:hypothetical protein